jgi:hypothetical protein
MTDLKNYLERRKLLRQKIIKVIDGFADVLALRGSWKYDDFHLNLNKDITYSDIDLLANSKQNFNREKILMPIEIQLKNIINIKLSIHPDDHFEKISLEDSKLKTIYEYIVYYKNCIITRRTPLNYFKAKTLLLLMKSEEKQQRYFDIYDEVNHPGIVNLYNMKIGITETFQKHFVSDMVAKKGDLIIKSFFDNCIEHQPQEHYFSEIHRRFISAKSISPWLKSYIISKQMVIES